MSEPVDGIGLKRSALSPEILRGRLAEWLRPRLGSTGSVSVSPLWSPGGGVANETFLLDATWTPPSGQERTDGLVLRLAAQQPLHVAWDLEAHAACYQALADVPDVPVPHVHGLEPDPEVLGAAFFVMERIDGDIPRDFPSWAESGFLVDAPPERRRAMWDSAVEVLAALHAVDVARFPFLVRPEGDGLGADLAYWRSYLDRGLAGEPFEPLERALDWVAHHRPAQQPEALSWGDARFCNLVFRDDRVVALLDWDQVSLAGPESDLAWWRVIDPGAHGALEGIGDGNALVRRWEELSGRTVQDLAWHDLYAQTRMGIVLLNLFRGMAAAGQLSDADGRRAGRQHNPAVPALLSRLEELGG